MRRRTDCPHHILQPDRHAFHWSAAAGKQLRGGENWYCQQSELTHGRRQRAEKNSKSSNHQGVKSRAKEKHEQRSRNRRADPPMDDELQRQHCCHENYETIGKHLSQHDLRRHYWHYQEMLDRSLLAFTDQRRAGQDHGQQRDLIDDLRHRGEPGRLQVRIEVGSDNKVDGVTPSTAALANEVLNLVRNGGLEIIGAVAGLSHRRCIDVDLDLRLALGENIGLEVWGNFHYQKQIALVHFLIDLGRGYLNGGLEGRFHQALGDLSGEVRTVLIGNPDREIGRFSDSSGRDRVDGDTEGVNDE